LRTEEKRLKVTLDHFVMVRIHARQLVHTEALMKDTSH